MSGYNETAYQEARDAVIAIQCPFERALLSRCVNCSVARRLLLAEREAISCSDAAANQRCIRLHEALHRNARFALHMDPDQPWPFGKEIRAQCGGLLGLQEALGGGDGDVAALVRVGVERYGTVEALPYSEIMRAVAHYEPRKRR
ncbi:MAG: hypothetical protein HZB71_08295 [Betaproteobacteria bacterium]|nr:hypothetical protein [Betaproteobacteria bacterium]